MTPGPSFMVADDFNDNVRNTGLWSIGTLTRGFDPAVGVFERNQRLEIAPRANAAGSNAAYVTVAAYDFSGRHAVAEIVQVPNRSGVELMLSVGLNASNHYQFSIDAGGALWYVATEAGVETYGSVPLSTVSQRFLRISHDATLNEVVWATSPDNITWTEVFRKRPLISLTAVKVEIGAGTWKATSSPGIAIFDNFLLY